MTLFSRLLNRFRTPWPDAAVTATGSLRDAIPTDIAQGSLPQMPARARFLQIAPSTTSGRPPDFFVDDLRIYPQNYSSGHPTFMGPTGDVGLFRLTDHIYDGRGLIRTLDGTILTSPETTPAYWRKAIEQSSLTPAAPAPLKTLGEPAIACVTPGFLAYGHWLLEILPRLWLAKKILGPDFARRRILIDSAAPAWSMAMMQHAAGVEPQQVLAYSRLGTYLKATDLIVPSVMHGDFCFHPMASEFFDAMADSGRTDLPQIFYVPRRSEAVETSGGGWRVCENAAEIETYVEARGIPIMLPEKLSWPDQISLFRRAKLVIGEYGSGLHGAVFSPRSTKVICLGLISDVQSKISGLRQHGIVFIGPSAERAEGGKTYWTFPTEALGLAIDAAL
jgi:hypothetical protein